MRIKKSLQHKKEIEIANKMLESLNQYQIQVAILRSKAKWYDEGEKSMKYFFNLKKINYTMLEQYTYYKKLFTSNPKYSYTHTEPFWPKLTNKERDSIESLITIEEIVTVLKKCNDKKSHRY